MSQHDGQKLSIRNQEGGFGGGHQVGGDSQWFRGSIDDIRIYNQALSGSEVAQLYAYESAPRSNVSRPAIATATVVNGFVVGLTVTDGGSGYAEPPVVIISGGSGTSAAANAVISNGVVTGFVVTNAGIGYTSVPTVRVASPPSRRKSPSG